MKDKGARLELAANYPFLSFYKRLVKSIVDDPENDDFNKLCNGAFPEYKGKKQCSYNLVRAMSDGYEFLVENVSPKIEDWEWQFVHLNEYPNMPWSFTPFKPLFHRESPTGGNLNTIRVSKYSYKKVHE